MAVTEKCDVYSFGVVALEILMGKHPGDLLSSLTSASTRNSTMNDVLDPRLSGPIDRLIEWDIFMVMRLAFSCISSNPKSRPTMQSVSQQFLLELGLGFSEIASTLHLIVESTSLSKWAALAFYKILSDRFLCISSMVSPSHCKFIPIINVVFGRRLFDMGAHVIVDNGRGIAYCFFSAPGEVSMGVISSQSLVIWEMIVVEVIGGYVPCP
ncbi:hypothetical protein LguiB_012808 [Lonicera macranthoides]